MLRADEFVQAITGPPFDDEDLARFRTGLQIAAVVWPVYAFGDWFSARAEVGASVAFLWTCRAAAWVPILIGVWVLRTSRPSPRRLLVLDVAIFSAATAAQTVMAARAPGSFASLYLFGTGMVLVFRGVIVAHPWGRGLVAIGTPGVIHLALFAWILLVLPPRIEPEAIDYFIAHSLDVAGMVLFLVIGNHRAWSLRRQVEKQTEAAAGKAHELEVALGVASATNTRLVEAQAQLVQSEKMASLGVLVAGVAHEINNPVTFIVNNVGPLEEHVHELRRIAPNGGPAVGELLDEVGTMVGIIGEGAERTAAIVKDLRAFSRLDEQTVEPVDVHEIIDVTLRLLRPRWADRIEVRQRFGDIGLIEAARGPLNQVFMNVLSNACDAIPDRGHVEIETSTLGDSVRVVIRDDGIGISQEHLSRVFDPFFTTKAPGKGTGLGLSITHGIIAEHGGAVRVEPVATGGTAVTIELPVRRKGAASV